MVQGISTTGAGISRVSSPFAAFDDGGSAGSRVGVCRRCRRSSLFPLSTPTPRFRVWVLLSSNKGSLVDFIIKHQQINKVIGPQLILGKQDFVCSFVVV
jgi:hypothetical protein